MSRKEKFDFEYKLEPNHFSLLNTRVCESDISEIKRSEKYNENLTYGGENKYSFLP
jgi:hypothetical protein